jgi:UDP-glucose 4-epimerase
LRTLITGGAGFIGSNVADRFVADGHEVAIVDNLVTGRRANLNPEARFFERDITDIAAMRATFAEVRPEVVIHFAAQMDIRRSVADPGYDARNNIIGSLNLIQAAIETGVGKFIYASTGGAVYGEPDRLPVDETHPIAPISQYGISKHTVEHYLYLYNRLDGLRYTVLRYAIVYGPRQNPHGEAGVNAIFAGMMLRGETPTIFGDGTKTRDYVYVGDVVQANVLALTLGDGEIMNIGTGVQTTDQEVYDAVAAAVGFDKAAQYGEERKGEIRHIALDASKAKRILGWEPTVPFREGVRRNVEYVKATQNAEG